MQLLGLCGRMGTLRRTVVSPSLVDNIPSNGRLLTKRILSGMSGRILTAQPSPAGGGCSEPDGHGLYKPSKLRSRAPSSNAWQLKPLRTQSSRGTSKADTAVRSDNGMQSLKTELVETSEQEETVDDSKKIFCEFVLQAFFNFLSVSAVAMAVANSGGDAVIQTIQVMAAHFVILPLTICAGAEVSGAHFNPIVTASFVLVGKISARLGAGYILAQLAGGVLGAAAAFSSLPKSMQTLSHAGLQSVPAGSTVQQAFVGEMCAAFALVLVLFSTNVDPRSQWGRLKPLSIPMVVCLLMWLVGPVSSMCINPARAFGPAVVTGFWEHHWIWWTAPFIGGLSAAKIYHSVFMPAKFR